MGHLPAFSILILALGVQPISSEFFGQRHEENMIAPSRAESLYAADSTLTKVHESAVERKAKPGVDVRGNDCPPDLESVLEAQEAQKAKEEAEAQKVASQNKQNVWDPHAEGSIGSGFSRYSGDDEYDAPHPMPQVAGPARKPSPARGPARASSSGGGGFRLGG